MFAAALFAASCGPKNPPPPPNEGTFKGQQADLIVAPKDMESHLRSATAKVVLINNLVDKAEIKSKVVEAVRALPKSG